jgi:hypothetical protein
MAKLDRFYSFRDPGTPITATEYVILGDSSLSDHLPVYRSLQLAQTSKRQSPYVMSTYSLKEKTVKKSITRIWMEHARLGFFGKLRRYMRFYKKYCLEKAAEKR